MAIRVDLIAEDLVALFERGPVDGYSYKMKGFFLDAMERDMVLPNMPMINVMQDPEDGELEFRSIPDGLYAFIPFSVAIITFSLTNTREAAKIRDVLLDEAIQLVRDNKRFSDQLETATPVGGLSWQSGTVEGQRGYVASVTFPVLAEVNLD